MIRLQRMLESDEESPREEGDHAAHGIAARARRSYRSRMEIDAAPEAQDRILLDRVAHDGDRERAR